MRVLLYAPVDLNLIDGSAIWCVSVAQMLGQDGATSVDILLHTPVHREVNLGGLTSDSRFSLRDPWAEGAEWLPRELERLGSRLTPQQARDCIQRLDAAQPYDLLIVRGGPICQEVAGLPRLAARTWFYLTQQGADPATVRAVGRSNGRIACQTPLLQQFFEDLLGPSPDRYVPLPPMVPRVLCEAPRSSAPAPRICYIGKFDPHYMIEELIAVLGELRRRFPAAELILAGDKFHDPQAGQKYQRRVAPLLEHTPGVIWRGGMPREQLEPLLTECAVGSCWRSSHYDDSLELSTKALEYAAAGLPVLLNPTGINRLVFGRDYPLYVDSAATCLERLTVALSDPSVYARAAGMALETCRAYTFAAVNRRLQPYLEAYRQPSGGRAGLRRPQRVLFAGHDFKFCHEIIEHFQSRPDCVVRLDQWRGHALHDERASEELLRWADAIWCEWCLGAAVWYSQRVRPGQRLIVRYHRQELTTSFPQQVWWPSVRHLIFIAPHVREAAREQIGQAMPPQAHLIYNTLDCDRFDQPQEPGSELRLGMLGYCPKLKNPRLAVEILERLLAGDQRWRLVLAGKPPQDYEWLWRRPEERAYYQELEEYIVGRGLEPFLIRQPWTDDSPAWYRRVGFILSCSDLEGSHQVVAEGMAAGCIPVVRRWRGAAEMYPNSLLFDTVEEAVSGILKHLDPTRRRAFSQAAREEARQRFDTAVILPQLEPLLLGRAQVAVACPAG